ncbi:uncharacterized protein LTR77_011201 [Saxophila tyrrhenica]|uniref:Methyltransferase domain-containing protein n=1 Tax=Saxophila tyrrhenica TaxID=1690608 RepID=A0AAV9NTS3_9PEZI|nr:hypothetical protein LTR77_011201 [Saxophila tyrrhenica]
MDSVGEDAYVKWMARDPAETERLNSQHEFLKKTIGHLLHPTIQSSMPAEPRIADIATGTCITLRDLASTFPPTCRFDGFDISSAQYPPAADLPSNIKLHVADAKAGLPTEFHSQYDVVNIRYLIAAMHEDDWPVVSQNMLKLLKPGGWLQWIEPDLGSAFTALRGDINIPTSSAVEEAADAIGPAVRQQKYSFFTTELANIMQAEGYESVTHEVVSTDRLPELRAAGWNTMRRPYQQFWEGVEAAKGEKGKSKEYVAKRIGEIAEVAKAGAVYFRSNIHVFLARKSME